ncbi:mechanosensitive ion channel domain-containing protein [Caenispirillum bisanense]|uniref:Small conductance mechanosensitive channel n=1 Tax=Caenispirillum bisanense TaxID=414052 RepID=A0A286GK40_9PROT|nr:mechanosensitive ion channel domain-containing protein [Caenispirillum bisanense]SOD95905.1 small conductance mechanosensitive channel [Caenispirillum bisanense]
MKRTAAQPRLLPALLALVLMLTAVLAAAPPAAAQQSGGQPAVSAETTEQLEALVGTLKDEGRRQQLIGQLEAMIAAQQQVDAAPPPPSSLGARLLDRVSTGLGAASAQVVKLATAAADLPGVARWFARWTGDPDIRARVALGALRVTGIVACALLALWIAQRAVARPRHRLEVREVKPRWLERVFLTIGLALVELIPPAAMVAVGYAVMPLVNPAPSARVAAIVLITALAVLQVVLIVARLLLAPRARPLRWLPLGDETAHYLYLWVRRLALIGVIGFFGAEAAVIFGLPPGGHALITRVVGAVIAVLLVIIVMQNRQPVAQWIRARRMVVRQAPLDATPEGAAAEADAHAKPLRPTGAIGRVVRERFADVWHILAALYVLALYGVWALSVDGGFEYILRATVLSAVVIALAVGLVTVLSRGVDRVFHISDDVKDRFPGIEKRANRYTPLLHTTVRLVVFVVAAGAVLQVWGVGVVEALASGTGRRVAGAAVTIAIVLTVSLVIWEFASSAIERYLSTTDADGNVVERSARAKTLLPLARNVLLVAMIVVVGLVVLSELGVNIAPLLAGAGVVGLAVGFGSQKLVQDIITGAFILFENTISVGDVVAVGGHSGVVEGMTVRSIRLRDMTGTVHSIPFSAVDKVSNLTKDFSYYVLNIGVAYREDTDQVVEVCKEILEEMRQDPEHAVNILEPLEVLGVDAFADSAVIIKARIKTLPIKQWSTGREYNRRMKKKFDELGIEIPFPHQTIYFGEDKQGKAPPARLLLEGNGSSGGAPIPPAPPSPPVNDTGPAPEPRPA